MEEKKQSTLSGLVSHYSPSGQEEKAVNWLIERMNTIGYEQAFVDEAGNAVGVIGTGSKQIVLLGHIDTVPGEIEMVVKEGSLYGRGSVDAKGPLACFVDAAIQAGSQDGWQIVVIGAVEEERDSDGAKFVVGEYKPDFLIVGEPNNWERIALGYKGSVWAEIKFKSQNAHSASGEKTAAEAGVEAWTTIQSWSTEYNNDKNKMFAQLLITLREITSESDDFEQICRLNIGGRLPPEIAPETWLERVETITKEIDHFAGLQPLGYGLPAWQGEKNTALVRAFLKSIRAQGGKPRFVYKSGTADINIAAPVWDCPAVVYGPGDSKLDHTPNEHLDLGEYEHAVGVLSGALINIMEQIKD